MGSHYGFGTTLHQPYEEAILRVKEALKAEGFGVLTEIDVRQTLREKLGAEMEPEIGLLLPCNVVVRAIGDGCRVKIADPQAMLGIVGNEQLDGIAEEAKQRLLRVVATLREVNR